MLKQKIVLVLMLFIAAISIQISAEEPQSNSRFLTLEVSKGEEPATLYYMNREIVTFRAKVANATPQERMQGALRRLEALPDFALKEKVRIDTIAEGHLVMVGSNFVLGIAQEDLDPSSKETLEQAAKRVTKNLSDALAAQWQQKSVGTLARGIALSLLATLIFVLILLKIYGLRNRVLGYFSRKASHKTERLKLFGLDLTGSATIAIQILIRLFLFSVTLFAIYVWLTLVFRQFPYTYPWGAALGTFFWSSIRTLLAGLMNSIPSLLTVIVIFAITRLITRFVRNFFDTVESGKVTVPGLHTETAGATRRLINALFWLFAIVIAYPYIPGSQTPAFKGISVFVGLMFTLGSAGVLNHLMSGLVLVYSRALSKGDYVAIGETEGIVQEVGPLSVKIATIDRREITIPNTVMTNTNIVNYTRISKEKGLILRATVTIGYDAPWRQVHAMLKLAASRTEGLRKDPEPYVLQTALSDFYVEYKLCAALERAEERIRRLSELHANIQDAFNEFGVQIMSPHFESAPQEAVFVPKSKWYSAPAQPDNEISERDAAVSGISQAKVYPEVRAKNQ